MIKLHDLAEMEEWADWSEFHVKEIGEGGRLIIKIDAKQHLKERLNSTF